jgi:Zn-dependent peptidase ImmA (M78 family)
MGTEMLNLNPEVLSQKLLDMSWGERGFPVDPVTISHGLGIKVVETDLPSEVSGAIIKDQGSDPVIVVEKNDSASRKRFTCAHELGHYMWHSEEGQENYEYVDLRDPKASDGACEEEVFANKFAANLLMPFVEVQKAHSKGMPNFELARYFGVSAEAIGYRLKNLGLKSQ